MHVELYEIYLENVMILNRFDYFFTGIMLDMKVGDPGYLFFSTNYGPASYKLFIIKNLNKSRKTIGIKIENDDEVVICTWRKTKYVPKGKKTKEYRCYNIYFGCVPENIKELCIEERKIPH